MEVQDELSVSSVEQEQVKEQGVVEEKEETKAQVIDEKPAPAEKKSGGSKKIVILMFLVLIFASIAVALFVFKDKILPKQDITPASPETTTVEYKEITGNAEFDYALNELLESKYLTINENSSVGVDNCKFILTYKGIINEDDLYAKSEALYKDEKSKEACIQQDIVSYYLETYWTEGQILNRQYENKAFIKISRDSKYLKANKPVENIKKVLNDLDNLVVKFSEEISGKKVIFASIDTNNGIGTYKFTTNDEGKIESITYTLESSDVGGLIDGKMTFQYESEEIVILQLDAPGDISTMFNDLVAYDNATYSVQSGKFSITTQTDSPRVTTQYIQGSDDLNQDVCYLDEEDSTYCQDKYDDLVEIFISTQSFDETPKQVFCEPEVQESGRIFDIYDKKLELIVRNKDRNPTDSFDYSFEITYDLSKIDFGNYYIRLMRGDEYCYEGKNDDKAITGIYDKLDSFAIAIIEKN